MTETIEPLIAEWRAHVNQANGMGERDVEELEAHLRDQIRDLGAVGLSEDEAFIVAVKRLGDVDEISREFITADSSRLWRQFVVARPAEPESRLEGLPMALGLAFLAAIAIQIPRLVGLGPGATDSFYTRNTSLMILPFLAWYFARRQRLTVPQLLVGAAPFLAAALVMNLYPWGPSSSTEELAGIHLPVALWFVVGFAYMGGMWRSHQRRMDFVRFTGEWFVYYALIALGGGVLVALTSAILEPVDHELLDTILFEWVVPSGAAGAVIIAAWLVEAKKSVVENMAPVLTMIFTPLFAVMLAASVVVYAVTDLRSEFDREAIFVLDILLIVVLALLLYGISARESTASPGLMDRIQLVAVVSALALDLLVLTSMVARISQLGMTPNRAAAIGLNLVLLANLTWGAWLSIRFLTNRAPFHRLERWQTEYFPIYPAWAAAVVVVLPVFFEFA